MRRFAVFLGAYVFATCALPAMAQQTSGIPVQLRLHPSKETEVRVQTLPYASCLLSPQSGGDKDNSIDVVSDDIGVASFTIQAMADHVTEFWKLDCLSTDTGQSSIQSIVIKVDSNSPEKVSNVSTTTVPLPASRIACPALSGATLTPSEQSLVGICYLPRPDPIANPEIYRHWRGLVSEPTVAVLPRSIRFRQQADLTNLQGPSDTKAGYLITSYSSFFAYVTGIWTIPSVSGPFSPSAKFYSGLWVGMGGGPGSDPMPQAGTQHAFTCGPTSCGSAYTSFYEVAAPNGSGASPMGLPVSSRDTVNVIVVMGDSNGAYVPHGNVAWFYMQSRHPNGTYSNVAINHQGMPASAPNFLGDSASWILERPTVTPQGGVPTIYPLAFMSPVTMSNAFTIDYGTYQTINIANAGSAGVTQLTLTDDGSFTGTKLADAVDMGPNGDGRNIQFTWYNYGTVRYP